MTEELTLKHPLTATKNISLQIKTNAFSMAKTCSLKAILDVCACACKHMKHLDNCTYNKPEKFALKHTGEDAGCVIEI